MNINPRWAFFSLPAALVLVGCGGDVAETSGAGGSSASSSSGATSTSDTSSGTGSGTSSGTGGGAACSPSNTSDFPDVAVEIGMSTCVFTLAEAAAGITVPYSIMIGKDVPNVYPARQGGCSAAGPSLLYPFAIVDGNGQKYCRCDEGLCPAPGPDPVTLKQGTFPSMFGWDGKNWNGPSDTGSIEGAAFPPGQYSLRVSVTGQYDDAGAKKDFKAQSELVITLVP